MAVFKTVKNYNPALTCSGFETTSPEAASGGPADSDNITAAALPFRRKSARTPGRWAAPPSVRPGRGLRLDT